MPKPSPSDETKDLSMDEKMDMVLVYLSRLDKRDRYRMIGSTLKSSLSIISLLLVLGSGVWFLLYGDEFVKDITDQVIKQSTSGIPTMDSIR
jgi:hypothetical protein